MKYCGKCFQYVAECRHLPRNGPVEPSKPLKAGWDRLKPYEPLIGALVLAGFGWLVASYLWGQW